MQSQDRRDDLAMFNSFNGATSEAIPSLLAFDHGSSAYVIGQRAQSLARAGQSIAQDLKRYVGETDQTNAPSSDRLNVNQDIVRLPTPANRTFRLKLAFHENGMVHPIFEFDGTPRDVPPLLFSGLRMAKEVDSFAGIDLGTSNTYVVNMLGEGVVKEPKFPSYTIPKAAA